MAIEHRLIPDAELHEPKGVVSASSGTTYHANGEGFGTWRFGKPDEVDYSNKSRNVFGWVDIADSQYTSASPRSIAASTRTKLTNNSSGSQTDTSRQNSLWNTSLNSFVISDPNATYLMRIGMKLKASAAAGTPYVVKLELESTNGGIIVLSHDYIIKGGSYENNVSFTDLVYIGPSINGYAMNAYLTSDTAITQYDLGFVIQRLYKES